ncbi:MAG: TlyA family RNA methyltransferase [Verrucomicrobiae bacterium]|nr:TlyA family RNA methyltransferase [Verrucomicrobiae bacterium]
MPKRLDQALVERGLCASREQAKRIVLAGQVLVNNQPALKPSRAVRQTDSITLISAPRYVSRGGDKLEHALRHFGLDLTGRVVVDIGASTGGFTDCALQHGASKVYAVDVGRGQLAWKLRTDPRVVVMENINARYLTPEKMPAGFAPVDLALIDCSFISLRKIIPAVITLVRRGGNILALVKPQFEAGKREAARGKGVITDPAIHQRVLAELKLFAEQTGAVQWRGQVESPLRGPAGNVEFFVLLEKTS